ncbi:MAG: non-hydrolyzing UDP-N-acetylglucosamine 2-epimerase [Allosphingosinicella sp.]|uniref:non-hydrolyzing UDP-N-acetylglucosamine 2-epimerase n=1 Tax=Allosphingosinicella sp. TaxID=2823234 RepID=UPI00394F9C2D
MKLLTVIGTRPEAIKMAPVLDAIETCPDVTSCLCVTGQHRDLLDQALMFFDMRPDLDLGLMSAGQSLNGFFARAMAGLGRVLDEEAPNRVIVQGDTASALAGALAAFQRRIPVSHVEAGLRTFDTGNPWPEEGYRQAIDTIADQLFAPTATAAANLRISAEQSVFVTGNSGIDAVHSVLGRLSRDRELRQAADAAVPALPSDRPLLLATIHRRESFGEPLQRICAALARIAGSRAHIVLPVHPNPEVAGPVSSILRGRAGMTLLDPLPFPTMLRLMQRVDLILTDSGGVQEEAATLGKPTLVLRTATDRPESVTAGLARLAGTETDAIIGAADVELEQLALRPHDGVRPNPFGDGRAAERIVAALLGRPVEPFEAEIAHGPSVPIRLAG